MKKRVKIFVWSLILVFCLCFSPLVFAHTTWINAVDYNPKVHPKYGAETKVYFGYGHRYPVQDFLSVKKLKDFSLINSDNKTQRITVENDKGFLATSIHFDKPGAYIVCAKTKPGFYVMYMKNGNLHHKLRPKTNIKGKIIVSLYYEQYTKCLIEVGKKKKIADFSKPVGHRLELIPLKNPYLLHTGEFLPVKVLLNGKPLMFHKVYATYNGFSSSADVFAYTTTTNREGIARIKLLHEGPWYIKTDIKLPPSARLKDKCNDIHYTATLTFAVP